jgi:hypothetical protein
MTGRVKAEGHEQLGNLPISVFNERLGEIGPSLVQGDVEPAMRAFDDHHCSLPWYHGGLSVIVGATAWAEMGAE